MQKIKLEDSIGYADNIKIIFDEKCVDKFLGNERCTDYTFREVLQVAKENGWKKDVILLIAENPLNGTIYQYGNYGDYWGEHGTTRGYA